MNSELEQWQKMADRLNQEHSLALDSLNDLQARFDALQADYNALLARATKAAVDARAVIANKDISPERTCEIIDASAAELLKNKDERELAAALQVQAEATAVVNRLLAK